MTRVLVVDDDPNIRQVIVFALADEGYEVSEAADGHTALDLISKVQPDVILLDMRMPGMDGWEFAKLYRQRYDHQAPIIVLSAAQDTASRGADINAEAHIAKPFDLDILLERVAAVVGASGTD